MLPHARCMLDSMSASFTTPWELKRSAKKFPALKESIHADVCIIGGGLTGVLSAYLLQETGLSVVLIERDSIGSGATGATTAFFTNVIDTDYVDLIALIGKARAGQVATSHSRAIELVRSIVVNEDIECEYVETSLFVYARTKDEVVHLKKEFRAAQKLGIEVAYMNGMRLRVPNMGHIEFPGQIQLHPLKLLSKVASRAALMGVQIFEETAATRIHGGDTPRVYAGRHTIDSEWVIVATHTPFKESPSLSSKKVMRISYCEELRFPPDSLHEAMYEDLVHPYHYFRVDRMQDHDRVILGGEDESLDRASDPKENFAALDAFAAEAFSEYPYTKVRSWKGPIIEPYDGLAYIGPFEHPRILYAFGYSGNGMTYAGIAAIILRDHILGRPNLWRDLYATARPPGHPSIHFR